MGTALVGTLFGIMILAYMVSHPSSIFYSVKNTQTFHSYSDYLAEYLILLFFVFNLAEIRLSYRKCILTLLCRIEHPIQIAFLN